MSELSREATAMFGLTVTEHAFLVHGLVPFFRDLANEMVGESANDRPVDASYIANWVLKLDTLLNALSSSSDDFSEHARNAGIFAPLAWGSVVMRAGT